VKIRPALILSLTLLAACGGGAGNENAPPATTAAAPPADTGNTAAAVTNAGDATPCALVTEAEATEIMGHPMKRGDASKATQCVMVSASGDDTKSVSFEIAPGTQVFDGMGAGGQPLSGIGDKAALAGTNIVIFVKNGRTYMGGVYDAANLAAGKDRSIAVAKKAAARM
jgi:hypothetical protein